LLKLKTPRLHVNAKAGFGELIVEVLDATGRLLAQSKPTRQDGLDVLIEWNSEPPVFSENPVCLRIRLQNARLYALWCD
jgi:hypothetical protein